MKTFPETDDQKIVQELKTLTKIQRTARAYEVYLKISAFPMNHRVSPAIQNELAAELLEWATKSNSSDMDIKHSQGGTLPPPPPPGRSAPPKSIIDAVFNSEKNNDDDNDDDDGEEEESGSKWIRNRVLEWYAMVYGIPRRYKPPSKHTVAFKPDGSNFRDAFQQLATGNIRNALLEAYKDFGIRTDAEVVGYVLGDVDFQRRTVSETDRRRAFLKYIKLCVQVLRTSTGYSSRGRGRGGVYGGANAFHWHEKAFFEFNAFRQGILKSCGCLKYR
jgi:hypothetical protein